MYNLTVCNIPSGTAQHTATPGRFFKFYLSVVYKVPVLEYNGKRLGESLDICKFLDQEFPAPALFKSNCQTGEPTPGGSAVKIQACFSWAGMLVLSRPASLGQASNIYSDSLLEQSLYLSRRLTSVLGKTSHLSVFPVGDAGMKFMVEWYIRC